MFAWIMEVEIIKMADWGYVRLYGYRPKSVTAGLGCGLGCSPALSVTTAALTKRIHNGRGSFKPSSFGKC